MHVLAIATVASVMLTLVGLITPVDLLPDEPGGAIIEALTEVRPRQMDGKKRRYQELSRAAAPTRAAAMDESCRRDESRNVWRMYM